MNARLWLSIVLCAVSLLRADVAATPAAAAGGELRVGAEEAPSQAHPQKYADLHEALARANAHGVTLKRAAFDGLGPVPQHMQIDPQLDFQNGDSWDPSLWDELWEKREREIQRQVKLRQQQQQETVLAGAAEVANTAVDGSSSESQAYADRKLQLGVSTAACDLASFTTWKDSAYRGILLSDPLFWRYQTQLQFVLSNGLALELAVAKCANRFKLLQNFKSGKGGPIDLQNVWKAMCTDECMQSDVMHQDAMTSTGCSCLELSTKEGVASYRVPGDWCLHNSAKMLCDLLGFCGIWGCRVDDFMCPRYEWNKMMIPYKGPGHCDRKANAASSAYAFNVYVHAVTLLATTLVLLGLV